MNTPLTHDGFYPGLSLILTLCITMVGLCLTMTAARADFLYPDSASEAGCPPCSGTADTCAFSCCLYKSCKSPAGPGCVSLCALGKVLTDIFGATSNTVTRFSSGMQVEESEYYIRDASIYRMFDKTGKRQSVIVRAGYYDHRLSAFLIPPKGLVAPAFAITEYDNFVNSPDTAQWYSLGRGMLNLSTGLWEYSVDEAVYLDPSHNYIVQADFGSPDEFALAAILGDPPLEGIEGPSIGSGGGGGGYVPHGDDSEDVDPPTTPTSTPSDDCDVDVPYAVPSPCA